MSLLGPNGFLTASLGRRRATPLERLASVPLVAFFALALFSVMTGSHIPDPRNGRTLAWSQGASHVYISAWQHYTLIALLVLGLPLIVLYNLGRFLTWLWRALFSLRSA